MQLRPGVYRPRRQVVELVASPVLQRKAEGSHLDLLLSHITRLATHTYVVELAEMHNGVIHGQTMDLRQQMDDPGLELKVDSSIQGGYSDRQGLCCQVRIHQLSQGLLCLSVSVSHGAVEN